MQSQDPQLQPDVQQVLEVILGAFADHHVPATLLLPSDGLTVARSMFVQMTLSEVEGPAEPVQTD